ncbi:MAG: cobalamin-binding protein [Ktedonobacterales bacterium]|nr:cobalamin-binding protein [Ktedonobacterales bacterium]
MNTSTPTPRVISLLASGTEIVAALGCTTWLVGRSHECDFPPEVRHLPVVSQVEILTEGSSAEIDAQVRALSAQAQAATTPAALRALSLYRLDVDLLRDLRPDVIITQTQCEVCAVSERDVTAALAELTGLAPRVVALAPYRLADVWEDVLRVGTALGRQAAAAALVADYTARLDDIRQRTAPLPHPRVALIEWIDPLMAAGNWSPELIEIAGGISLFGAVGTHSPWLTWDDLTAADPEVIVVAPCGFTLDRTRQEMGPLVTHPLWLRLRAVQTGRVYLADGNAYFNRSGPRLVESAALLAAIFHDERDGAVGTWERLG